MLPSSHSALATLRTCHDSSHFPFCQFITRSDHASSSFAFDEQMREGQLVGVATNVHFVADGKPWQKQRVDLGNYTLARITSRAHHLLEWWQLVEPRREMLLRLNLSHTERRSFGIHRLKVFRGQGEKTRAATTERERSLSEEGYLHRVLPPVALMACRCFLRKHAIHHGRGRGRVLEEAASVRAVEGEAAKRRLLAACGGGGPVDHDETTQCQKALSYVKRKHKSRSSQSG